MTRYTCICSICNITYYRYRAPYPNNKCGQCQRDYHSQRVAKSGATAAHAAVQYEILCGRLADPKSLDCVDCGFKARLYDHRDYNKPLEVEPVCGSCNNKRWKAISRSNKCTSLIE